MEYASHIWGGSTHTSLLEKLRPDFPHSFILSLSNSLTPDLTAMLCPTCALLVKSATHSLLLFFQLPMTYTPLNVVYQVTSAFDLPRLPSFSPTPVEFW